MTKVVGTVLRHTVGYQNQFGGRRSDAPLSFSYIQQFANVRDRTTLSETLKRAMQQGYIRCVSEGYFDPDGGRQSPAARYALKWLDKAKNSGKTAETRPAARKHGENPTGNTAENRPGEDGKNPTDIKTEENNTLKQQHDPPVAAEDVDAVLLLIEAGFDKATAGELERKIAGISRVDDYRYFIRNDDNLWRVLIAESSEGMTGFLISCGSSALNMIGPGVALMQDQAAALFYEQLNQQSGRCPVLLVPLSCGSLVKQLYAWGARNCEMHVAQSHGPAQFPAGVIIPTFLPETG
jgi:hypothetical protein